MTEPDTRTRIIREAARMFADDGVKATTIARIEHAVGLRPGSGGVHRYFATKDDLVRAVLEDQLARGEASRETAQAWPLPSPGQVEDFLRMMGAFALHESQYGREVALIGLREGRWLYDKFPDLRHRNFEIAFVTVAEQIRAFQAQASDPDTIDPEALAFLFMGPLLYHRVIEWVSGAPAIGLTDERLIEQWARLFAPVFEHLIEPDRDTE
jgi:AcrR family transcriptional regulator